MLVRLNFLNNTVSMVSGVREQQTEDRKQKGSRVGLRADL
jgi:hypothetical protein